MPTTIAEGHSRRPINHGTPNAYFNRGCRCRECCHAGSEAQREARQAKKVPHSTRVAIALSILNHREPTEETCRLAIRALRGYDVIAEAAA